MWQLSVADGHAGCVWSTCMYTFRMHMCSMLQLGVLGACFLRKYIAITRLKHSCSKFTDGKNFTIMTITVLP